MNTSTRVTPSMRTPEYWATVLDTAETGEQAQARLTLLLLHETRSVRSELTAVKNILIWGLFVIPAVAALLLLAVVYA